MYMHMYICLQLHLPTQTWLQQICYSAKERVVQIPYPDHTRTFLRRRKVPRRDTWPNAVFWSACVQCCPLLYVSHRALRHIRPLITIDAAKMIASSIVGARLDYCNSLLFGTTACNLDHVKRIQNTLACAVLQKPFSAHSTELWRQLHWLPIRQRIEYKIAAITFKANHSGLPVYLHDLVHDYHQTRTLRSSTANKLQHPPLISLFSDRLFSIAAPTIWNSLSPSTRSADAIGTFKSRLKTDLFALAYIT